MEFLNAQAVGRRGRKGEEGETKMEIGNLTDFFSCLCPWAVAFCCLGIQGNKVWDKGCI